MMRKFKDDPYILLTSLGLFISLAMVAFIVGLIMVRGLGFFWPRQVLLVELKDGTRYLGEVWETETVSEKQPDGTIKTDHKIQLKIGNRDLYGLDFTWVEEKDVVRREHPPAATVFERLEYGNFYGMMRSLQVGEQIYRDEVERHAREALKIAHRLEKKIEAKQKALNELTAPLNRLQRELSLLKISDEAGQPRVVQKIQRLEREEENLKRRIAEKYRRLNEQLLQLNQEKQKIFLQVQAASGETRTILLADVVRFYQPNRMSRWQKIQLYFSKLGEFLTAAPRESNTEGGVFPAIFGTVMMVLLMSIAVVPFGVLAAIYLNEYAKQGVVVRLIRLSVNNLAGVPSIVFGIFGLGFFIYVVGGSLDQLFFSDKLPEPTLGTGGILWASLTLALLTLPVVVVATEEGILAVPRANKEGALALGATRWQMIRQIVLPNAMPGILTGLILAISRGAGEVAPLMITGVVKLAPTLPIDGTFPFLHLDRKFMHLGFHIYDVGFQSPNVEAAKPMVYTTALLLILIVIFLNLLAIFIRNRLKKKYKASAF